MFSTRPPDRTVTGHGGGARVGPILLPIGLLKWAIPLRNSPLAGTRLSQTAIWGSFYPSSFLPSLLLHLSDLHRTMVQRLSLLTTAPSSFLLHRHYSNKSLVCLILSGHLLEGPELTRGDH